MIMTDCNGNILKETLNQKTPTTKQNNGKTKTAAKDKDDTEKPTKPGVSLVKVLWKTFGMDYAMGMSCNFFNTCLHFLNPILLK